MGNFKDTQLALQLLQEVVDYISLEWTPEDVFSDEQLVIWAEENGYVKENE